MIRLCVSLVIAAFSSSAVWAAASPRLLSVGSGALQISLDEDANGARLSSITVSGQEALNTGGSSELFILDLGGAGGEELRMSASEGWGSITTSNTGTDCRIEFSQPQDGDAPTGLVVVMTLEVDGSRSHWDLDISGLGSSSVFETRFPMIDVGTGGDARLLLPRYSGILLSGAELSSLDWSEIYPAGWHSSMQFLAHYNSSFGLYFGYHDSTASIKTFHASTSTGGLLIGASFPAPDRGVAGNAWQAPGVFELDAFEGDWFDAALIYRGWALDEPSFWPSDDPVRRARLEEISAVNVWANFGGGYDPSIVESNTIEFAEYMGVPSGLTWYQWNYLYDDDNYPEYFPERTGMTGAVTNMSEAGIRVVPYINGRLFDTDLDGNGPEGIDFSTDGEPYAIRDDNGDLMTQVFTGNLFAYMCPTQAHWQDFLVDAGGTLTTTIGCSGLYIDQIGAASPLQCMDPAHGHPLGGGSWWRSGYRDMLSRIHGAIPSEGFLTTESGADAFIGDFEGFMVQGWQADGMVPAFQAVYADVVRFFGMKTGVSHYNDQQFYCKLGQAFAHGIQLGRFYTSIRNAGGDDEKAPLFVRQIARMRYKLGEFFNGGRLQRPVVLSGVGSLTTIWQYTYDGDITVTIPQVPTSSWMVDAAGRKAVALVFVNASISDSAAFSFDFDATEYGLTGELYLQEITEDSSSEVSPCASSFNRSISLDPLEAISVVISTSSAPLGAFIFEDGFESGTLAGW